MASMNAKNFYGGSKGKSSIQARLEQADNLVNAITNSNDSDLENLSDGEDTEAYDVPDADENEDDSPGEESDDDLEESRDNRWKRAEEFDPDKVPFDIEQDDGIENRGDWGAEEYFKEYFTDELFGIIAHCTNYTEVGKTGVSLRTSSAEVKRCFGIAIAMSCIKYPRTKMFWSSRYRIPLIFDAMSRDRFFKLRCRLKAVIDNDIPDQTKKADAFWKVRPILERVHTACSKLTRSANISIDEQMVPFTGQCPYRQHIPSKPNPTVLKNFVAAAPDGLVFDFELYQGRNRIEQQIPAGVNVGVGGAFVVHLSRSLGNGTSIFCDRYFTTVGLIDFMLSKNMYITGTVMKNRIGDPNKKLMSDRELKRQGRGSSSMVVRRDGQIAAVKWYDNKPVLMLSSAFGKQPQDICRRWSKHDKEYIQIERPSVVKMYNDNMGGVDQADRLMSYYRIHTRTRKWTIRTMFHFVDLAITNSWILYRRDQRSQGKRERDILQSLDFRFAIAEALIAAEDDEHDSNSDSNSDDDTAPAPKRNKIAAIPGRALRTSGTRHMPEMSNQHSMRCRLSGCGGKTKVRCTTCNMFLCLTTEKNCFSTFHSSDH